MILKATYILARDHSDFLRLCERMAINPLHANYLSGDDRGRGTRIGVALAAERWLENPAYTFEFLQRLQHSCAVIFTEGDIP